MAKRFITPFAEAGDRAEISNEPIGSDVNMQTGYPAEYEADPVSDPNARFVERDKTNQLYNDITANIKEWQENTYPAFITAVNNGGTAFAYKKGDRVSYNGDNYESLEDANQDIPTTSKWAISRPTDVIKAILIAQGLSGSYGFFDKGFEYVGVGDVGIATDGKIYTYVGTGVPIKSVTAGTNPAGSGDYELFNLDLNYSRFSTLSDAKAGNYKIGSELTISDRGDAKFNVVSTAVLANGYNTILSDNGLFVLELKDSFTTDALGVIKGADCSSQLNDIISIMKQRGEVAGSRVKVESLGLNDGQYVIGSTLNLDNIRDFYFYSVSGGKGKVTIETNNQLSSDVITATDAAFGVWEGITFKDLVNNDNNMFAFGSSTSLIRGWDFKDCEFIAVKRCFRVTGTLLCSEFTFNNCAFLQCHTLMYNNNTQAVNWNFYGCDWENDSLIFSGDNATSSLLYCDKGTFLTWNGGSIIPQGGLVFCNWTAVGDSFRASHKVSFNNVRIEISPTSGGTNPPLVNRNSSGYVNASNSMPVLINDSSGLVRAGVVSPYVWANVWNKSSLVINNSELAAGEIHGLYDSNTAGSEGELVITNNTSLKYVDDPASAKSQDYVNHFVDVSHEASQGSDGFDINQRNATTICSNYEKIVRVRSATGRIPLANTEQLVVGLPKNATILSIGYRRLQVANTGNSFTAELRNTDKSVLYATVTLATNERVKDSLVLLESGIDIPTDLVVVFTGTPEIAYGYFELRYM